MKKRIILTLFGVLLLVGLLAGIKVLQFDRMAEVGSQFVPPPQPVTSAGAQEQSWESTLPAVGSLTAVQGVTVAAELPGKVVQIAFTPGASVRRGDLLLQQDISAEQAQLPGAEAEVALQRANLERIRQLLAEKVVSQAEYDSAEAAYRVALAAAANIRAAIGKKTIRAPFSGRLGVRLANLGQVLKEGEAIVSLQSLDPIYADFSLPQQQLAALRIGMPVRLTSDALPGETVAGTLTTISPEVDASTRNIRLQATLENPDERLRPGMYVNVAVILPERQEVLAIPATAVLYAPYSDSVFIIEEPSGGQDNGSGLTLRQQFVRLGEKRGDFVAVVSGLKAGETVVSTGVFKLRNGQAVVVDNTLAPEFQLAPQPENN